MSDDNKSKNSLALRTFDWAINGALNGIPGMSSSADLAEEYGNDPKYHNIEEKIDSLIRWQVAKNGGLGVASGALGVINVPVALGSIATSFGASWLIQARLAGAIALLYGHDLKSDRVRTAIMWVVLGDTANAMLSASGKAIAETAIKAGIKKIPNSAIKAINQALKKRVITKFGEKGIVNLGRLVPLFGGVVGGAMDGGGCYLIGKSAKKVFRPSQML